MNSRDIAKVTSILDTLSKAEDKEIQNAAFMFNMHIHDIITYLIDLSKINKQEQEKALQYFIVIRNKLGSKRLSKPCVPDERYIDMHLYEYLLRETDDLEFIEAIADLFQFNVFISDQKSLNILFQFLRDGLKIRFIFSKLSYIMSKMSNRDIIMTFISYYTSIYDGCFKEHFYFYNLFHLCNEEIIIKVGTFYYSYIERGDEEFLKNYIFYFIRQAIDKKEENVSLPIYVFNHVHLLPKEVNVNLRCGEMRKYDTQFYLIPLSYFRKDYKIVEDYMNEKNRENYMKKMNFINNIQELSKS